MTNDPAADTDPAWSPDGNSIAFTSDRSGNEDVWVMPVAGGAATRVTNNPGSDREIYVMTSAGANQTRMTNSASFDWQPDWGPMPVAPTPSPTPIGSPSGTPFGPPITASPAPGLSGDVDCDGDVDAVDSLSILQFVAALPVALPPGCPHIGTAV